MKQQHNGDYILTPAEVFDLREFVLDILHVVNYDDTGVTDELVEKAETAAEILGIHTKTRYEHDVGSEEWDGD